MATCIINKSAFARAEMYGDGTFWIAECRRNDGTWVIREAADGADDGPAIFGEMFPFPEDCSGVMLLVMTAEERDALGMSDRTYQELNALLRKDDAARQATKDKGTVGCAPARLLVPQLLRATARVHLYLSIYGDRWVEALTTDGVDALKTQHPYNTDMTAEEIITRHSEALMKYRLKHDVNAEDLLRAIADSPEGALAWWCEQLSRSE
jgi:hypothetical protein